MVVEVYDLFFVVLLWFSQHINFRANYSNIHLLSWHSVLYLEYFVRTKMPLAHCATLKCG